MKVALLAVVAIALLGGVYWYSTQQETTIETPPESVPLTEQPDSTDDTAQEDTETDNETASESETDDQTTEMAGDAGIDATGEVMIDDDESEAELETSAETEAAASTEVESESTVKEFTLDSFNFGYSETEIRVNEGDTVTINLTNSEGFHDWVVDEFDAATERISAGETTSVTFVADSAGTYEYYCSVGSHRAQGMVGTLIVE